MAQRGEMAWLMRSFDAQSMALQQPAYQVTNGRNPVRIPVLKVCDFRQGRTASTQGNRMALGRIKTRSKEEK